MDWGQGTHNTFDMETKTITNEIILPIEDSRDRNNENKFFVTPDEKFIVTKVSYYINVWSCLHQKTLKRICIVPTHENITDFVVTAKHTHVITLNHRRHMRTWSLSNLRELESESDCEFICENFPSEEKDH